MAVVVHPLSKMNAKQFVAAIHNTPTVPSHYRPGFFSKGTSILVDPTKVRFMKAHSKVVQVADWFKYLDRAADAKDTKYNKWFITTGALVGAKGGFLPGKIHFKGQSEPTAIKADLPARILVWTKKPNTAAGMPSQGSKTPGTGPGSGGGTSQSPTKIDFTKEKGKTGSPAPGSKMPEIIKKPSIGAGDIYAPSQAATTDALGICIVHRKWPDSDQSPIGHIGKGGVLVVANRVDASTFKSKRAAKLMSGLVAQHLGETIVHEMIHAGIYASGTKMWIGHPKKKFGPFL